MSKSLGNFYTIDDVKAKEIDPLALRYFYLTAHYSKHMNFTWEALEASQSALTKLQEIVASLIHTESTDQRTTLSPEKMEKIQVFGNRFMEAMNNDLNTPQALAVVWEMVKSNIPESDKRDLLYTFDEILGFGLIHITEKKREDIPEEVISLLTKREEARKNKQFDEADNIRKQIESAGYDVFDTPSGAKLGVKNVIQ
jgi:cysteinyl-tRNA synthetase